MNKSLCVINTPVMTDLIQKAKSSLCLSDYNFKAEIDLAHENRHASMVVRRAIRNFLNHIREINLDQWERFSILYQQHRSSDTLAQSHLRIMESGERQLREIRQYIESNPEIYEIMSVKVSGIQIPSAMLIICALAWVSENTYSSPARENPHF